MNLNISELSKIFNSIFFQLIDILLVSFVLYQFFYFIRNTRGFQVLKGFIFFFILTIIAGILNLTVIEWMLRAFWTISFILIIIIFQPEIRRALAEIGKRKMYSDKVQEEHRIHIMLEALAYFSKNKIGALIVFERSVSLNQYIENSVVLNSNISSELIKSIFADKSPLHDGAVIIQNNKIAPAASFLPLSKQDLDKTMGGRHRAALGITEKTDAFILVVSEETGAINFAHESNMVFNLDDLKLNEVLSKFYKKESITFMGKLLLGFKEIFSIKNIKKNLDKKLITLVLGIILWYYIKYQVVLT